ncbi:MAG: DUF655 domain-containing protein [Caldimonas sp.]
MFRKFIVALAALIAATAFAAVDANKATQAELEAIKGIGPVISTLIISERKKGEFKSWTDFTERVKGVGDKSAGKFSESGLTVNGTAYRPTSMKPAKADAPVTARAASAVKGAASATKVAVEKAASATKAGAAKAASAVKAGASTVASNAREEKEAFKDNVKEAKEKRAAKKAEKAAAASAAKK